MDRLKVGLFTGRKTNGRDTILLTMGRAFWQIFYLKSNS